MTQQASAQQAFVSGSAGPDYLTRFVDILNNRAKTEKGDGRAARTRGFVVIVNGDRSLAPLQAACFEQTWNRPCLTARYRIQPGAIFGTLIAAFVSDLKALSGGKADLRGVFRPAPAEPEWESWLSSPIREIVERWPDDLRGSLIEADRLELFLKLLREEAVLPTGMRLVLFGEITESAETRAEWDQAMSALFTRLPERFGLTLSGAPEDFGFPDVDPHFLRLDLPEGGEPPAADGSQPLHRYIEAPLHTDRPAREDRLGVNDYAEAMARFLLHKQTQPPLVVGIQGKWGKGKSSFMELVDIALIKNVRIDQGSRPQKLIDLHNDVARLESELGQADEAQRETLQAELNRKMAEHAGVWSAMQRKAQQQVISVRFNAWQYQDATQIWAGLASAITERLETALPRGARLGMTLTYVWKKRRRELIVNLILPVLIIAAVGVWLTVNGGDRIQEWLNSVTSAGDLPAIGLLLQLLLPAGSLLFVLWFLTWRIMNVVQPVSERVLSYVQLPSYREQMGYQHRVMADLQFAYHSLRRHWPQCKVMVYIDDLDRCSDDKIMEILQAINLILGNSDFFVFLGMDTEMIYRAIRSHYGDESLPQDFPEDYLRKIIQLSFHLPEIPPDKRFALVTTLFSARAQEGFKGRLGMGQPPGASGETIPLGVATEPWLFDLSHVQELAAPEPEPVEDTPDELMAYQDYREFLEDNPREIKRLVNIHRLVKILVQRRDTSWPAERQRKLIKWLIFCTRWPDLIDDVLARVKQSPAASNCLEDVAAGLDAGQVRAYHRLKQLSGLPMDRLSAQDIDEDFRQAAQVSQLVREAIASHTSAPEQSAAAPRPAERRTRGSSVRRSRASRPQRTSST